MFKSLFSFLKSLFMTKQNESTNEIVDEFTTNEAEVVNASELLTDDPTGRYKDVFGNPISFGDQVVCIKYNEYRRRGYMSIRSDYSAMPYTLQDIRKNVIKYDALMQLIDDNRVKNGYKSGYLHIVAA